jgi:hypothetical protein
LAASSGPPDAPEVLLASLLNSIEVYGRRILPRQDEKKAGLDQCCVYGLQKESQQNGGSMRTTHTD